MRNTIVRCSACDHALSLPETVGGGTLTCTHCQKPTRLWLFPALYQNKKSEAAQVVLDEGHSSCMNHPNKRAVSVCDGCGKFLCALCDIDWNGEHLCSNCIEHRGSDENKNNELRTEYIHYDRIVFGLALFSIVLFFLGVFIAPVALFMGWRYWNEPWRPVPYRKWGMIFSLVLAFVTMTGWATYLTSIFVNF